MLPTLLGGAYSAAADSDPVQTQCRVWFGEEVIIVAADRVWYPSTPGPLRFSSSRKLIKVGLVKASMTGWPTFSRHSDRRQRVRA